MMKQCTLLVLAALAATASGQAPSIETTGDDMVVSVPVGASLKVRTYDARGNTVGTVAIVTQQDLDKFRLGLQTDLDALKTSLEAAVDRIKSLEDDNAAMSTTLSLKAEATDVSEALQETKALSASQTKLDTAVQDAQKEITTLSSANEKATTCLGTLAESLSDASVCPKPTGTICDPIKTTGSVIALGAGTRPGAARFFSCPKPTEQQQLQGQQPMSLVGSAMITCSDKGVWSAPVPKCVEMVSCRFGIDDWTTAIYVDGKRVAYQGEVSWAKAKTITFPATAKLIGIKGGDNQRGCAEGGFVMMCTSSNQKWNGVKTNDQGWRADHSHDITDDGNYPDGGWAAPSYDASTWKRAALSQLCVNGEVLSANGNNPKGNLWLRRGATGVTCYAGAAAICAVETDEEAALKKRTHWWFRFNIDEN